MIDAFLVGYAVKRAMDGQTSASSTGSGPSRSDFEMLQLKMARLTLLSEALWLILKEKHGMTDEELMAKIEEIDARDGVRDGRAAKEQPRLCPQCNRVLTKASPKCLYCGQEVAMDVFGR
jgi:hypothetical protein